MQTLDIGGSLTATGVVTAASIGLMHVHKNLAGTVTVTGLLGELDVDGKLTGTVNAGSIGTEHVGGTGGTKVAVGAASRPAGFLLTTGPPQFRHTSSVLDVVFADGAFVQSIGTVAAIPWTLLREAGSGVRPLPRARCGSASP